MRMICVPAFMLAFTATSYGADLSRHSALGEIFVERPAGRVVRPAEPAPPVFAVPVRVPGYYGGYDTTYRNYYGTSPVTIFSRLPYACKWHGLC